MLPQQMHLLRHLSAGERFKIIDEKTVMADIDFAAANCRRQDRLFLVGGDALILPQKEAHAHFHRPSSEKLPLGAPGRHLRQHQIVEDENRTTSSAKPCAVHGA